MKLLLIALIAFLQITITQAATLNVPSVPPTCDYPCVLGWSSTSDWSTGTVTGGGGGGGGSGRQLQSSTINYFVNCATGNDTTGNGTSVNPWATPTKAYDYHHSLWDMAGGQKVNVNLVGNCTGTYAMSGRQIGQKRSEDFMFIANGAGSSCNPGAITVSSPAPGAGTVPMAWIALDGAEFALRCMTIQAPYAGGFGIVIVRGVIKGGDLWFGPTGGSFVTAAGPTSQFTTIGSLTPLSNSNPNIMFVAEDYAFLTFPFPVTVSGCPSVGTATVQVDIGGIQDWTGGSFSGCVGGKRYNSLSGGKLFTGGSGGPNFFPGTSAGFTDSISYYQ